MIDFARIAAEILSIAYGEGIDLPLGSRLQHLAIRLRSAHEVLWRVTGGSAAIQQNRRFRADIYKHGVPTAEVSALPRLAPPMEAFGMKPTARAIRYALKALRDDFEPRDIPYAELRSLRRFLEAQLPEET